VSIATVHFALAGHILFESSESCFAGSGGRWRSGEGRGEEERGKEGREKVEGRGERERGREKWGYPGARN